MGLSSQSFLFFLALQLCESSQPSYMPHVIQFAAEYHLYHVCPMTQELSCLQVPLVLCSILFSSECQIVLSQQTCVSSKAEPHSEWLFWFSELKDSCC